MSWTATRSKTARTRSAAGSPTARRARPGASRSTTAASRSTTRRSRRARRRSRMPLRARGLRPGRPHRDGLGQLHRPRGRVLRVRARRHRVRPAVVAPHRRASSPTCSRRSDPALVLVDEEYGVARRRSAARAASRAPIAQLGTTGVEASVPARSRPACAPARARRRPAARDLHLGQRGRAEGRRADARELLLEQPRPRAGAAAHAADDVVLAMLPQFHVAAWNCQPLLAWWVGATVVLERSFQPARALQLIARAARHRDDGRSRRSTRCSPPIATGTRRTCRRCASRSSAARRCRPRCTRRGPRAASRSRRATASPRPRRTCCTWPPERPPRISARWVGRIRTSIGACRRPGHGAAARG